MFSAPALPRDWSNRCSASSAPKRESQFTLALVRLARFANVRLAVREGDALPDISSREALRKVILDSAALYVPDTERVTAGIHFAKVLHALGIYETVEARVRSFASGTAAMSELAKSTEVPALGCTLVTEVRYTPGVSLVGPLPAEFELVTAYSVGVFFKARQPELARCFTELLSGNPARALRLNGGFEV